MVDFWQTERKQLRDAARGVDPASSRVDYFARQLTPLMRALLLAGAVGFSLLVLASSLQGASPALLTANLLVILLLAVIAAAGFAPMTPDHLSVLGLSCVITVEVGIMLIGADHGAGLRWVLPGFVLLPIAASPVWLTQRDFAIGTLVCVVGPALTCWMLRPDPELVVQSGVYMLIAAGVSVVIHTFMVRQLYAQYSLEQRLRAIAGTDDLTGIANRGRFFALAHEQLAATRQARQALSALYLDIDLFKTINDDYGHAAGDHALIALVGTMRAHLRADDIIGRIGGEEFAVLLPQLDEGQAVATANRLRSAVAAMPVPGGPMTISVGVAMLRHSDISPDALLSRADVALRQAKRDGRDRVRVAGAIPRWSSTTDTTNVVQLPKSK